MCFSHTCPAEDYSGECTRHIGPFPCDVEEAFESPSILTEWLCPACHPKGRDVHLAKDDDGIFLCRSCGTLYEEEELSRAYRVLMQCLVDAKADAEDARTLAQNETTRLRAVIGAAHAALREAV